MKLSEYLGKMELNRSEYSVYKYEDREHETATLANANRFALGRCLFGCNSPESELAGLLEKEVVSVGFFPGDPLITDGRGEHYITVIV